MSTHPNRTDPRERLSAVDYQIEVSRARLPPDLVEPIRTLLAADPWGLWCTLYVDASNAGRTGHTAGGSWAWGARGRATDSIALLFGGSPHLRSSGLSPEAGSGDSGVGELWGVVHAVRAALAFWPWLAGIGIRCDNAEAVRAVGGCDGRGAFGSLKNPQRLASARDALRALVTPLGVGLRAVHVRGHSRANESAQRAFNRDADLAARQAARAANRAAGGRG